jgi:Tol biopolymer transport system component/DNA-binding winged helix-turn-helix (wHTH) protein
VELASQPGRVFSRNELLGSVWDDVIVGEEVLTRGISELRRLLADDSRVPRYIETIRKGGYRIIAERRAISPTPPELAQRRNGHETEGASSNATSASSGIRRMLVQIILGAGIIVCAIWVISLLRGGGGGPAEEAEPWQPRPLTSYMGNEVTPALSPDGRLVAFSWSGPKNENYDIYVLQIGDASPLRLTEDTAVDIHPVWSPDGMRLAYISDKGPGAEIRVVPVLGGTSRRLLNAPLGLGGGFSWSPDSVSIVYATRPSEDRANQLYLLDVETGETRALTVAPPPGRGDIEPEFSPDGHKVAFIRCHTSGIQDLWLIPTEGGDARCVRAGFTHVMGLEWARSGRELLCSALYDGSFSLWRVNAANGEISWSSVLGERIYTPSVARNADRLVYHYYRSERNIWRLGLVDPRDSEVEPIVVSTHWDDEPSISPDGQHLAFTSTRSGTFELWVSRLDGSTPHQITDFNVGLVARPSWSPDSEHIAFNASPRGLQEVYVTELEGGSLRRLDSGFDNAFVSDWSNDGRWLYISAEQAGRWNIWRLDLESPSDSMVVQATARNAIRGYESTDGYFYYSRPYQAGLWRLPLAQLERQGRPVSEDQPWLPDLPRVEHWNNWRVCQDHVFLLVTEQQGTTILRHDPDSDRLIEQAILPGLSSTTITLDHDCRNCYFVWTEREHGDLMLVEGFQ